MSKINFKLVRGEPVCNEECVHRETFMRDSPNGCNYLTEVGSPCVPGWRQQRDEARGGIEYATGLMHATGFTDIWYAHPGPDGILRNRWHAGFWTGPQKDLICVKKCETNEEAEEWLSPGANTPIAAILAARDMLKEKQ